MDDELIPPEPSSCNALEDPNGRQVTSADKKLRGRPRKSPVLTGVKKQNLRSSPKITDWVEVKRHGRKSAGCNKRRWEEWRVLENATVWEEETGETVQRLSEAREGSSTSEPRESLLLTASERVSAVDSWPPTDLADPMMGDTGTLVALQGLLRDMNEANKENNKLLAERIDKAAEINLAQYNKL